MGTKLEGLEKNLKLQTLDVALNKISVIENIDHLQELEEFWANNNEFGDWENVKELAECKKLITVYLENNPVQTEHRQVYRRRLQATMPKLKQIDGMYNPSA